MTTWPDERIPIWVEPAAGESLDSWLEAYSRRLSTSMPEFLQFLGLRGARLNHMLRCLTEHERQVLSRRTGLSSDRLTAMTLEPWDGLAVTIDRQTRRLIRPPLWRHSGNKTRYCPRCLGESTARWQLSWRLPWSFACTRHKLLLLDRCPKCGQPPLVHGYRRLRDIAPGTCLYGTGSANAILCGYFLPHAEAALLPSRSLILDAQHEVNTDVLGTASAPGPVRQRGQELAVLARSALHGLLTHLTHAPIAVRDVLAECGGALPELTSGDAHSTAVGTAIARIALHRQQDDSDAVFTWLMATSRSRRVNNYPTSWLSEWVPAGPRVTSRALAAVAPELTWIAQLRFGTTTSAPAWPTLSDEDVQRRAARLPAILWPSWTMRLLPRLPDSVFRMSGIRRTCAALLLMPGTTWDYSQATRFLGNQGKFPRDVFDSTLRRHGPADLAAALVLLARALDSHPAPIDYARRRATFSEATINFDLDAYQNCCRQQAMRAGPVQIERMRWRLLRLLLGADPGTSSRTPTWCTELPRHLNDKLKEFLFDQAAENLRSHGITEPVSWQPPSTWIDTAAWPGANSNSIDNHTLSTMMAAGHPLKDIAKTLRVSVDHIHLHIEATGIGVSPPLFPSRPRSRGRQIPRQGLLAPDKLQHLYQEKQLSLMKIAKLANCSHSTVRKALHEAEIPCREQISTHPILPTMVSREWLEREYIHKGRTTLDIAHELGFHRNTVTKNLKRWGISRHPNGLFLNPFASLDTPLSSDMKKVSRTKNCLPRLRHLLQLPGHRNLSTAAASLGVQPGTLRHQLRSLEATLEFTLITRTNPLSSTSAGAQFLAEAQRLIDLLKAEPSTPSRFSAVSTP
ncbi:TniQ family protein [Streptomyces sp. NPDC056831]|uniref:TniQ family protein n=1 Tax=Streptomyces sp. NPDC056831 TaxID=3345954 RepID=UPI00368C654E